MITPFWTAVLILVAAAFVYKVACKVFDFINGVITAVIAAPGKGLAKLWNAIKGSRKTRLQRKLGKVTYKEDIKARKNAALTNPSYLSSKKAKKIKNKLEAIEIKESK